VTEAILEHGGEALASRGAFTALPPGHQADLVAFLENLVLFKAVSRGPASSFRGSPSRAEPRDRIGASNGAGTGPVQP